MKNLIFLCVLIAFVFLVGSCRDTNPTNSKDTEDTSKVTEVEFHDINLGDMLFLIGTELSPDGSIIAISGIKKQNSSFSGVFDTKTGIELFEYESYAFPVNFSDDGSKLLFMGVKDTAVVINTHSGEILQKFSGVSTPRMLPDGSAVIFKYRNQDLKFGVYSVLDGKKIKDLTFTDIADSYWDFVGTRGSKRIILVKAYEDKNLTLSNVKIIEWDITTDTKVSEITIPNILYNELETGYTSDRSAVVLREPYTNSLNFFNTQTGVKINSVPIVLTSYRQSYGFSNDLTFATRKYDVDSKKLLPLATYNMSDLKSKQKLTMSSDSIDYTEYAYSNNSQFLAGFKTNNRKLDVRIWKLK